MFHRYGITAKILDFQGPILEPDTMRAFGLFLLCLLGMTEPASGNQIRTALSSVLPQVEFVETPLPDVVEFLQGRSREMDPSGAGVNVVIDPAIDPLTTVTLRLSEVSIGVVLICLAEQTDLDYQIDSHAFRLVPFGMGRIAEEELLRRDHSVSSPQAKIARELALGEVEFVDAPVSDVLEFLSLKSYDSSGSGLNLVVDHRIDESLPVRLHLHNAAASTVLWAMAKQTSLEIRVTPYAILIEPPGAKFYREQRIARAEEAARKSLPTRPRGKGYTLGTPPNDPRSPAHPDYVGSNHPDRSKRTNALNNVYKWAGGKWTFVRYGDGADDEGGLETGTLGDRRTD